MSFSPDVYRTFFHKQPGTYTYFCTIHPWMDGVITVQGKAQNLPNYPVYASGARISKLPIYNFTPDGKIEAGLSWDPNVLLTGKLLIRRYRTREGEEEDVFWWAYSRTSQQKRG